MEMDPKVIMIIIIIIITIMMNVLSFNLSCRGRLSRFHFQMDCGDLKASPWLGGQ